MVPFGPGTAETQNEKKTNIVKVTISCASRELEASPVEDAPPAPSLAVLFTSSSPIGYQGQGAPLAVAKPLWRAGWGARGRAELLDELLSVEVLLLILGIARVSVVVALVVWIEVVVQRQHIKPAQSVQPRSSYFRATSWGTDVSLTAVISL